MVLKVLNFNSFYFCRCVVALKELIFNSFYFGRCGGLEKLIFNSFYFGEGVVVLKKTDF